jgi:predicted Zn-dependent protease
LPQPAALAIVRPVVRPVVLPVARPAAAAAPRPRLAPCRPLLCALLAAALGLGAATPVAAQGQPASEVRLPALGESASEDFNLSQEKRIGEQIMREIRRDPDYIDDPQLLDYLQALWQPLVQAAKARGDIGADTERLFPYEAFLVRDRSVNAFALPGGYVGVHLGLMALTATPDELASVLAHELSHITRRHIARSIAANSRSSTVGLAAMLLGLLVASRASSVDVAQAAILGGQGAMVQAQLNFSRDMEREADRSGLALMGMAGFAPAGMAGMFDKLDQSSRLNDSGGFPYLRSHPLTVDRIGEARQIVQAAGGAANPPPAPLMHLLMQARAHVLMDPTAQAWRKLQDLDARGAISTLPLFDRIVGLYTGALASGRLRELDRAERSADAARALLASSPNSAALEAEPQVRQALANLSAQLALARGDATAAAALLSTGHAGGLPDPSRTGLLLRAELALAGDSAPALRRSSDALQTWVAERREDASAWQLLGQIQDRQGQKLRSLRSQAESQAALGNLPGAIDRLRAGQQLARKGGEGTDFIEASVIDARLRDLLAQRRTLLAEQRGSGQRGDAQD